MLHPPNFFSFWIVFSIVSFFSSFGGEELIYLESTEESCFFTRIPLDYVRTNPRTYSTKASYVDVTYVQYLGRDGAKSRTKNDRYVGNAHVIEEKHSSIVDYHTVVYLL